MLGLGTGINKLSSAEAASIASRSGGYLLDTYSGAAAAYSLRQLSSSYSGNAVKVRRSSDNTETDIGFVGGELDTASLSSFAGAGDAFVVSWFDQSGNGLDVTTNSATYQPQIVASGTLYVSNGKPSFGEPAGGTRYFRRSISTNSLHTSNEFTTVAVYEDKGFTARIRFGDYIADFPAWLPRRFSADQAYSPTFRQGGTSITNSQVIAFLNRSGDSVTAYQNNTSTINATDTASIVERTSTQFPISQLRYNAWVQEYIIWPSDLLNNRTDIQDGINNFYGTY